MRSNRLIGNINIIQMNKGKEFADRLIKNIKTSLELRSHIPDMATLKDLAEGGARLSAQLLNTSSNFGSFDTALREVLVALHARDSRILCPPKNSSLQLTVIYDNLSTEIVLLTKVIQEYIDEPEENMNKFHSVSLVYHLDTINSAAV